MAAVFLNFIFEAGVPDRSTRLFLLARDGEAKDEGSPPLRGNRRERQGKLRGHRGQGKLRGMEWQGTLGNSAGTKDIRNSGMTRRVSVDCFGRSRGLCTNEYINNC